MHGESIAMRWEVQEAEQCLVKNEALDNPIRQQMA